MDLGWAGTGRDQPRPRKVLELLTVCQAPAQSALQFCFQSDHALCHDQNRRFFNLNSERDGIAPFHCAKRRQEAFVCLEWRRWWANERLPKEVRQRPSNGLENRGIILSRNHYKVTFSQGAPCVALSYSYPTSPHDGPVKGATAIFSVFSFLLWLADLTDWKKKEQKLDRVSTLTLFHRSSWWHSTLLEMREADHTMFCFSFPFSFSSWSHDRIVHLKKLDGMGLTCSQTRNVPPYFHRAKSCKKEKKLAKESE